MQLLNRTLLNISSIVLKIIGIRERIAALFIAITYKALIHLC